MIRPARRQFLPDVAPAARAHGVCVLTVRDVRDAVLLYCCCSSPQFCRVCTRGGNSRFLEIVRLLATELLFVFSISGHDGGAVGAADLGDAEDGLPGFVRLGVGGRGGRVAEAGGGEGALGPAVVDAGEVPVYLVRGGVSVQLVADVDEVLDDGYVDVVDGAEVEDDGFQGWLVGFGYDWSSSSWAGVVPWSIL